MNKLYKLHNEIANESVTLAANNVTVFVQNKNRLIKIFAENEIELIRLLANSPDNDTLRQRLTARVKHYFPNNFTFTIADKEGDPLLEDFEGFAGEVCLKDLKYFADHKRPLPRIHPNSKGYHFDVISQYGNNEGILFISFHADILGNILKSIEAHNHQLLLILEAGLDLIEVTSKGARNHLKRDDYRLRKDEKDRIFAMMQVPHTVWTATDLRMPALFADERQQIFKQSIVTLSTFVFISIIFLISIARTLKKQAKAENIRDEFLSTISHELRTPLTSIRGALGLVIGGVGGVLPKQAEQLSRTALKNTDRMIVLVNDLLDLRKLEAGQIALDMHPANLIEIAQKSIYLNEEFGKEFGVEFALFIQGEVHNSELNNGSEREKTQTEERIMIMANKRRIEQAINNLLSNAAKYGASNETVEIAITTKNEMVRLEVRDKGPGVPPSFQASLFEKPSQSPKDAASQGLGYGLAVVNYIVKLHHGHVGYEIQAGYGAIFYFELPIMREEKMTQE